jgi:hypothetical protein
MKLYPNCQLHLVDDDGKCLAVPPAPTEDKKETWCEHSTLFPQEKVRFENGVVKDVLFCPFCGKERPSPKSLKESLVEKLEAAWQKKQCIHHDTMKQMVPIMAQTAIDFINKENGE